MKLKLFEHPPKMTVSEFAEANVVFEEGASRGQKFSYKNRPYFREPSDAMGDSLHNHRVVIVSPSQLGKSTAFLNYLYYIIVYNPDNTLILLDSQKTAEKLMKTRIRPFLRSQVKLESLQRGLQVDYDKSSSTTNISLAAGKNILMGSARSASDLCSFSCRYLLCDETSRYPDCLDTEGDPISLALQRTETYHRPMAILTSTPTTEDCTIWSHYLLGTQNRWSAVCECGCYMPVYYKDIDFSNPENPTYACPECGTVYDEYTLQYKLVHTYAPDANPNPLKDGAGRICKSYHIPGTLCPERYSWKYLREKELASRMLGAGGYMTFVNTSLGEVYYPGIDESIDVNKIVQCRRYFEKTRVPRWVKFVTCGVDTQDNRFELVVIGSDVSRKHVCFIERKVILGDLKEPQVWNDLRAYLNNFRCTPRDGQELTIHMTCIDSGGHYTQDVYAFCLQLGQKVRAVKGIGGTNVSTSKDLIYKVSEVGVKAFANGAGKIPLTLINTLYAKDIIREQFLKIQANNKESNWVVSSHLDANFDSIFFDQINSEFRENLPGGRYRWVCKPGVRNEALDCTVYALTAVDIARLITGNAAMTIDVEDSYELETPISNNSDGNSDLTLDSLLSEMPYTPIKSDTASQRCEAADAPEKPVKNKRTRRRL